MKTEEEGSCPKRREAFGEASLADFLLSDFEPPGLGESKYLCLKPQSLFVQTTWFTIKSVAFVVISRANKYNEHNIFL